MTARTGAETARTEAEALVSAASGAGGGVTTALYLPGVNGNNVSTPGTPAMRGAVLDIRAALAPLDTVAGTIAALSDETATDKCWWFYYSSSVLRFRTSSDGSATVLHSASVSLPFVSGSLLWVRVVWVQGSPSDTATFYTSTDGKTWTQLGTVRSVATKGALYATPNPLRIGSSGGFVNVTAQLAQRLEVRSAIDGPVVASWDGRAPAARYRDPQGNIWTVNGTANAWQVIS